MSHVTHPTKKGKKLEKIISHH